MIVVSVFFFNDTATTEIYTLSLHDALPISLPSWRWRRARPTDGPGTAVRRAGRRQAATASQRGQRHEGRRGRSEEHTSELQSRQYLVCRLLLEKKKKKTYKFAINTEL